MRTVTIARGECRVCVEWFDWPCPICRALVSAGTEHFCRLVTVTPPQEPKEAK